MSQQEFQSLLCTITANTVNLIMRKTNWNEDEAMDKFVRSRLYSLLEREDTKVWHYSATMLSRLFDEERSGKLVWSEGL